MTPSGISATAQGHHRLRVPDGKHTSGNDGKLRDAYFPAQVERDLKQFQNAENIALKDPFIDLFERGVRGAIKSATDVEVEETGNDDFHHVSSHDLRRRFAQRLLVDEGTNPRVVMQVGRCSFFETIEPYLKPPNEDVVDGGFTKADF